MDDPVSPRYRRNFSEARPIDVSERGEFFALALDDGRFMKVSADVLGVIECLVADPPVTEPAEIADALRREGTADLAAEDVGQLIETVLLPREIVVDREGPEPRGVDPRGSRLWFHLKLFNGRSLGRLAAWLDFLFTRRAFTVAAVCWAVLTAVLLSQEAYRTVLSSESYRFGLGAFLVLVLPSLIVHELGHALSCFHFGVRAREMGMGMYLFRPVVYTDMSEAWLLGRRERVVTDLAGTYFTWLYVIGLSALALVVDSAALLWALVLLYFSMLVNLNPFLRFDGYWVITDWTGVVNVHRRALALLWYHLRRLFGRKPERPDLPVLARTVQRTLIALSFLYLVFTVLFLYLGVLTLARLFFDGAQREAFLRPFIEAVRALDPLAFLHALKSGGLVSLMIFYLLMLSASSISGLVSRTFKKGPAEPSAVAEGRP